MKNKRIVSLVPSLTELLADLGLQSHLVGATRYCIHPPDLKLQRIGGTKDPDLSKIIELKPDYLLVNREENRKEDVEALAEVLPNCTIRITEIDNFDDSLEAIALLGIELGVSTKAQELIDELKSCLLKLTKHNENNDVRPLKVLYLIWKNPWMTVGADTYIHNMLHLMGLESCINDLRYPVIEESQLLAMDWDVLLLSSEPYPFKESDCLELIQKAQRPVILVNGEHYSWYGTRLLRAYEQLESEIVKISKLISTI